MIGRLVAFRDPIYANAAWAAGNRDQVVQSPSGDMFSTYGGFTNFTHEEVRAYNRAIALEAESMGVNDILWDYIRRPEGDPDSMVIPGLEGSSSDSVTSFLAEMQRELRPRGAYQGASVFGIAAAAGDSIAQDVPSMGAVVDYLAPMVYPSHWGPGMYRVDNPVRQPYDIVKKSVADFQRVGESTGVRFLPWLQDFTIGGVHYGEHEVREQIRGCRSSGSSGSCSGTPTSSTPTRRSTPCRSPRRSPRRPPRAERRPAAGSSLVGARRSRSPPGRGARGAFPSHSPSTSDRHAGGDARAGGGCGGQRLRRSPLPRGVAPPSPSRDERP